MFSWWGLFVVIWSCITMLLFGVASQCCYLELHHKVVIWFKQYFICSFTCKQIRGEFNKFVELGIFLYNSRFLFSFLCSVNLCQCRPRWLSWMRRPTEDQEVAGSSPAEVGNILSWRLIMKYFLRSFSPFRWFKKDSCQFLAKECAQYWLTA